MTTAKPSRIEASNYYREMAEDYLQEAAEEGTHQEQAGNGTEHPLQVAAVAATLAVAYETRTTALVQYFATLTPDDRHEGPAVLALIKQRLGLISDSTTSTE